MNRKDEGGANVFEGGFLGLDNIGVFNRSEPLPTGGVLRQADGTAWMAFYSLNMLVYFHWFVSYYSYYMYKAKHGAGACQAQSRIRGHSIEILRGGVFTLLL